MGVLPWVPQSATAVCGTLQARQKSLQPQRTIPTGIVGMRGCMAIRLRPCMMSTTFFFECAITPHYHTPSLTRVTKSYLSALGTTQISSYITKHWTKFLTHQTGNYPVTCFVSKPSRSTLVVLSIINTSYHTPLLISHPTINITPPY